MEIILYNTDDEINTIGKTLVDEEIFDIRIKSQADITRPTIMLKSDVMLEYNYAYISEFKRYYFIESIDVFPNKIYHLELKVDVLESYKDDILNSNAYINQNTNYNKYYNSSYEYEVKKEVDIYESDVVLPDTKSHILVTIGGG